MEAMREAAKWFWDDDFWLPPNVTWADIRRGHNDDSSPSVDYAVYEDLYYGVALALPIVVLKFLVEKRVFRALGRAAGLKERRRSPPPPNSVLEAAFSSRQRLDGAALVGLAKRADMTERQVERWLRQRSLLGKASKLDKFAESAWKALCYGGLYGYSWWCLWDKAWFWDIKACWFRYPEHSLTDDVWWYYMVELGFYFSLLFSQFFDVQRSDFWEMFAHHLATLSLISLSWTCNLFRVGTLVIWVHDCADVFLESAKMFKYVGLEKISDLLFYSFAVSWVVTRLGYFPTWIIYSITVEAGQFIQYFPAYNVFSLLLSILLILNLFWFYFIAKVAYLSSLHPDGKIERDLRSESNSSN